MDNNQANPHPVQQHHYINDEIDLQDLFWILWAEKWFIIGITAVAAVLSVVVSLMMTEIYRAEATLAPADTEQSTGGLEAQFGGAVALLGVNVASSGGNEINNAIATLTSRQFIKRFIAENNLLVSLFASSWDKENQRNVVNEEIYNSATGEWLRKSGAPTDQEAYRLVRGILNVNGPDRENGLVVISIDWHNPVDAADWVNKLISTLNHEIRYRDVDEANHAIAYLRQQLEVTQLVEMQRVFYQLIESQTRITMLADVREEYVFRVIDPAAVPDTKIAPSRVLIFFVGTLLGFAISIFVVLVRRVWQK